MAILWYNVTTLDVGGFMKKFFTNIITLAIIVAVIQSCQRKAWTQPSSSERILSVPTPQSQTTVVDQRSDEEIAQQIVDETRRQEREIFVNETIYRQFLTARENYEQLFKNGSISGQIRNTGVSLNDEHAKYIDESIKYIYDNICAYISSYEAGNVDGCINSGKKLYDFEASNINKDYVFSAIVSSQLPEGYQSPVGFHNYGHIYDGDGNIVLSNGNRIHLIGGEDALLCATPDQKNPEDCMITVAEWYKVLPTIITNRYRVVRSNSSDNGICYVWNETNVERACRREWAAIRQDGQSMYGINPDTTVIRFEEAANGYVYEDQEGTYYGPLDFRDNMRVDHIYEVQDALATHTGNVYALDQDIKDMINAQSGYTYSK